jgi:acyl carrier protein
MNEMVVRERLTEIFHDLFADDSIVLRPEMTAADVTGWDSIKHISLIVAVEDAFGIKVKTAEMDKLTNVGALEKLIAEKATQ